MGREVTDCRNRLQSLKSANIGHTLNLKTSNEAPIGPLLPLMKWVVSIWSLKE